VELPDSILAGEIHLWTESLCKNSVVLPALGSTGARNAVEVDPKTLLDSLTRPPSTQPPKLPKREEYLTI
jgi:hypothetical protein